MNIHEIPNIKTVAIQFVELEILINDLYDTGHGDMVRPAEAKTETIVTTLLTILGLCTYGGTRQWCREQLRIIGCATPS